jgi:hypothetical protein
MSGNTIFHSLAGEEGVLMDKLAHGGSGNSNTFEFDENLDSSLPPVTHIRVTLSEFLLHNSP